MSAGKGARTRRCGAVAALLSFAWQCGHPTPATAQHGEVQVDGYEQPPGAHLRASLRDRWAEPRAEELLSSADPGARIRGIQRLAGHGSDKAIALLIEALDEGSRVYRSPRARLAAVRALAPHSHKERVVTRLAEILAAADDGPDSLSRLARQTAALALVRADSDDALSLLLKEVVHDSDDDNVARDALIQHPPPSWRKLKLAKLDALGRVAQLLGEVGDPRVLGLLRKLAKPSANKTKTADKTNTADNNNATGNKTGDEKPANNLGRMTKPAARAAAVVALAKLGDNHALRYSKLWLAEDAPMLLRLAAVRARVLLAAPGADKLVAALLADEGTREPGFRLAEQSLSRKLLPALAKLLEESPRPQRERAAQLIARIGGPGATPLLLPLLGEPEMATRAAFALANLRHPSAALALAEAMESAPPGAARRLALRALLARHMRFGATGGAKDGAATNSAALTAMAERLLGGENNADRAVAAAALSWLDDKRAVRLLDHPEPAVALAAAGALLQRRLRAGALLAAFERAAAKNNADDPLLLGLSSVMVRADPAVSSARLAAWAKANHTIAPAAAYRLARRDSRAFRRQLRGLLDGADVLLRLHIAWGLQHSPQADATSLLAQRYTVEADVRVRRVLLRSLSWRRHAPRKHALKLAAQWDPDASCRAIAARALAGEQVEAPHGRGRQLVWLSLHDNRPGDGTSAALRPLLLVREDGSALALVAAPDGVVLAGGWPEARRMSLQLAPGAHKRDP